MRPMFKGKAGSLQFLKALGFKVPDFIVIKHDDIVSWGDQNKYAELIDALSKKNANVILGKAENFIHTVKVPDLKLSGDTFFAVRSSASLEDSPEHSFAGIFETKLFVTKIPEAIQEVWLSLFQAKSLHYCLDRNLSWSDLRMDIVIQEMVNGDKSGVLFQADPLGKIGEQIIVAGYGLGQGIVDEETDTDRYVIEGVEIKESDIAEKHSYLAYEHGQIQKNAVPSEKSKISVLSQSEIEKLLTVSVILSTHTDHFMDVEFTFRNGDLYVLQARPITTLPSKKQIHIFDNSNIAENYPGFSTPLTYSGLARGYTTNFKNLIRFVGFKDEDWAYVNNHLNQLVGYWGGQIYYNLNNWYSVYTLLPYGGEKAVASFNEMVGINSDSMIKVPHRSTFQKMRILSKILPTFLSFHFNAGSHHKRYKVQFKELYLRFQKESEEAKSAFEILHVVDQLDNEYLSIIKVPLFNDFFSSILNSVCRTLAKKIIPANGEQLYNDLLSNREDLESSRAIYSLIELSEIIQKDPALEKYLESSLEPDARFEKFFVALKTHFDRFGDRSQWEMKLEMPTARENPEITIKLLLEYARAKMSREEQRNKEKEKSEKARKEFSKAAFKKPLASFFFWLLFSKCTDALSFREDSRFDRVRFKGVSRKLVLKLGNALVEKNWLNTSEDLFYLTYDEVMSLTHDSYGPGYWKDLVALRKRHLNEFKGLKLPDRILSNDLTSVKKFAINTQVNNQSSLKGIPCSGGLIETECEIVLDLNQAPSLTGKILVAERTDPSWGYFFVGVKGIIIEKGSMLSHAAIISRELGIPCIINVKNATSILKSGMKVKMNGDTGEIEIIQG
jgi:phosphohistidine swiveling domain-containing protein